MVGRAWIRAAMVAALVLVVAGCSLRAQPVDEAAGFAIRPYLQRPTQTGMSILWSLHEPTAAVVRYGEGDALDRSVPAGEPSPCRWMHLGKGQQDPEGLTEKRDYIYDVRIEGLKPGVTYRYQVRAGKAAAGGEFRTIPAEPKSFRFVAYGDSRTGVEMHRRVAAQFNRHSPDFILHSGDMVSSGPYFQWVTEFFGPLAGVIDHVPLWPARGNHEGDGTAWRLLFDLPEDEQSYTFTYGNAEFFVLNSTYDRTQQEALLAWLTPRLAASKARWKIAMYHYPTYDRGRYNARWGRANFAPAFRKYGIDLVISGHSHSMQRFRPVFTKGENEDHPITYLVSAGGGAGLHTVNLDPYHAFAAKKNGFSVIQIEGDTLSGTTYDADGKQLDAFEIRKPGGRYDPKYLAQEMDEADFDTLRDLLFPQLCQHVLSGVPDTKSPVTASFDLGAGERAMDFTVRLSPDSRQWYAMAPFTGRSEPGKTAKVTLSILLKPDLPEPLTVDKAGRLTPSLDLWLEYAINGQRGELKGGRLYAPVGTRAPTSQEAEEPEEEGEH